ncbi:MAG TPA: hypothetical protein VJL31_08825, partial [Gemmatimonadales bacterium]|nr:hypothetical protein [Gemmatimonadales bacterium]
MKTYWLLTLAMVGIAAPAPAQDIPSPAQRFGHAMGADRKLVGWDGIVDYLRLVAQRSDRVNLHEVGKTSQDRPY